MPENNSDITKEANDKVNKIGDKISFLEDPYHKILVVIILAAIIYHIYWFIHLGNQAVWWDEATYLNTARVWLGMNHAWQLEAIRPILLTGIIAAFMAIGLGETAIRLFLIIFSVAAIPLLYGIGRLLFNKRIGIIAALILSFFWSYAFYTHRILTDVPVAVLWLACIFFFLLGYLETNKKWHYALGGIFLSLSFLMKFSSVALIAIIGLYYILTEKKNIFKDKGMWMFCATAAITILPFLLYQAIAFGGPLAFYTSAKSSGQPEHTFLQSLINQTIFGFNVMHVVLLTLFVIGLLYSLFEFILLAKKYNQKQSSSNKKLFVYIWLIISLLFFGYNNYGSYIDERYYFVFYPAIFLIAAVSLNLVYDKTRPNGRNIALALVIVILAAAAYQNITNANQILADKRDSEVQIKEVGTFVNQNTKSGDWILISGEAAELTYYTQRDYVQVGSIERLLNETRNHNPKYIVLSLYYFANQPDYTKMIEYIYSNPGNYTQVQAYGPYIDKQQKIPVVSAFRIN